MTFDRHKRSIFSSWWWTVDRITLIAILAIIGVGAVLVSTASPAVAERVGLPPLHFIKLQMFYLALSMVIIFVLSLFTTRQVQRLAILGYLGGLGMLVVVLLYGSEIKGATRWISIFGQSLQPSEFIKPLFAVFTAWLLSKNLRVSDWKEYRVVIGFFLLTITLLLLQPDLGMTIVITAVWAGQLFVAGIPVMWVSAIALGGVLLIVSAYFFFPHVTYRIDSFIASLSGDGNYQVKKSLSAFESGGLFGRGPGEGVVKQHLPDSHTDFIFAVAGEELGAFACVLIVLLYGVVIVRGLLKMLNEEDRFIVLAVSGLLMQFGIQASINMGVALNLFPTKGMTLPFISYGGSSMLAIAVAMGMMLALTRRRYGVRL